MLQEVKDMLRELKNPWLATAVVAMLVLIVLLYNIKIGVL